MTIPNPVLNAFNAVVIWGGLSYWLGGLLPVVNGWQGYQAGALVACACYLFNAHQHRRYMEFLVPFSVVLPVVGHEWDIWKIIGGVWALTITYWFALREGRQ